MRIFIAGGTGAIGKRLVPLLASAGHHVIAATRTPAKLSGLRALGVDAILVDGLDWRDIQGTIASSRPDVVVHQMTSLGSMRNLKRFDEEFERTNRLRTLGTRYLLEASVNAGVRKLVAQSFTGWPNDRRGGIKTEADPLDANPPESMRRTLEAIRTLESTVSGVTALVGTVLRYGALYGPGTSISDEGEIVAQVRRRRLPVIGGGAGVWSFVHIDDAARATQLAVEHDAPGIFNIVDDDPADAATWIPELASAVGARPPLHLPVWIARLVVGDAGVSVMTQIRGSSNEKAKETLRWRPQYSSWRAGFRRGLSASLPIPTFAEASQPVSGRVARGRLA